ncbi:MAG TPA: phosphoribosyltransferase family protein [Candidatus Acidoferrum sp.]|nr:phosphoribosyltransferase family protein [Candidatus Acidoferrum sp.]
MSAAKSATYSAGRIAKMVAELGRKISKDYGGRRVDAVVTLDRGFIFAADLLRQLKCPVHCHFVREEVRDVEQAGHVRREVFFGARPDLKGRDVLVLDVVLESGVTQDFLLRRLGETNPRSLRLAVLVDKTSKRRVALEPDYFGFRTASNDMWVGYGLAAANGTNRNWKDLSSGGSAASNSSRSGKRRKK